MGGVWIQLIWMYFTEYQFISSNESNILQNNISLYQTNSKTMPFDAELFQQIHSGMFQIFQDLEHPTLKNNFIINQAEIQLSLTHTSLFLYQDHRSLIPTHFCPLAFSLKFEVIYQTFYNDPLVQVPIAIKFERQNCTQTLTFVASHPSIAQTWSLELEKKINQRNFHKLFKAKKKIGKGAFATVYLAERLRDHKMVAVKAFSKQKQYSGDKGRQSLQNQIKLMRMLSHTNIMKLEGVYETENSIYVILEYLQGQQLNQMLRSGKKLQAQQIKQIMLNILQGLSHLSKHKIIHRDLKPQNIIFRHNNSQDLAICDFGLATHAEEQKYLFVRCGTPGFVAPQIINIKDMNTKSDPVSDIFSAGVIFHYLLFGSSVFQGKKYNEILTQNRSCDFDFTKQIYGTTQQKTLDLLTKMLEKDPSNRITAENALSHPFFIAQMDVQLQQKNQYSNLAKSNSRGKYMPQTPSSVSKKKVKQYFAGSTTKQSLKPFLFS